MRRRFFVLALAAAMVVSVAACGKKGPPKPPVEDKVSGVSIVEQPGTVGVSLDNRPLAAPDEDVVSGPYMAGQLCDG